MHHCSWKEPELLHQCITAKWGHCKFAENNLQTGTVYWYYCRCNGQDVVKAAEWYHNHLGMPVIVIKGSLTDEEHAPEQAVQQQPDSPELEEGDALLDELLDLDIGGSAEEIENVEKAADMQELPPKPQVQHDYTVNLQLL